MIAVYITIGLVAGVIICFLLMRLQQSKIEKELALSNHDIQSLQNEKASWFNEKDQLKNDNDQAMREVKNLHELNKELNLEVARLKTQSESKDISIKELKENFEIERKRLEETRLQAEKNSEKLRKESDEQWQLKFDKLKEELQNITNRLLTDKQESLQQNNKEQIGEILKPIREQFDAFRKSVEESKTSNEVAKKELKDSFESTMKLFAQQQSQAVEALKQETTRIGNDANNLTNVLKRDTKKQGNWGELILESLLESSGLEKDIHYFIQETVKDEEGKMLRPDVIVKFPEGRSVIIDSKVSLTAYTESFETEDEEIRRKRLKDHAKSVRKHVDELAVKKYDTHVTDAIGFVLMFIPNDQCYLAAMEEDSDLSRYAYDKSVIIISPSNLMMTLQLAFHMWQQDVRNKNIDKIVSSAGELYDKVAGFSESMESLEKNIGQLTSAFNKAKNQLYEGNGNIMRKVENLKKLGITPKKQIKGLD